MDLHGDLHEDPEIVATGVDALRALGMSDDAIREFISAAALPGVHANELELQSRSRLTLQVSLPEEGTYPGWVVMFPLPVQDSSAFGRAVAALPDGAAKWDQSEHYETLIWVDEERTWYHFYEDTGGFPLDPIDLAVGGGALWFLGKFADAYVSRIADRLAETTFKAAKRIRLRRSLANDCVIIKVRGGTTTIVLPEPLTDEAREAFIDLDPVADGIRGKTLYWDQNARVWVPPDQLPPDQNEPV